MKQIAFIFSIILLLCSCKSSESTNSNITLFQEKDIYTTLIPQHILLEINLKY